ncbi:MAG: superoxide dismutase [Candidatus Micrarchaeales archaeon]
MAKFELPQLPYAYNALAPFISEQTMKLHHDKHHQAYVDNLNKAIDLHPEWGEKSIEEIIKSYDKAPDDIKNMLRNHGGGHYNHSLFWDIMSPKKEQSPPETLSNMIKAQFGDIDSFKKQFGDGATKIFGSGWQWLVVDNGKLALTSTPNQDSPLTQNKIPILGLDVWEHAYYVDYQNRRADYISAWWNVVNWSNVETRLQNAMK